MTSQCEECLDFIPKNLGIQYKSFVFCGEKCLVSWKAFWETIHQKNIIEDATQAKIAP